MAIASLYSSRGGLEPGSSVFVGRDATFRDVFMRLSGSNENLPGVAVVGPRRIGKTSFLKQLLDSAVRARYVDEPEAWHVAYLDVSRHRWTGFGSFRKAALDALGSSLEQHAADCFSDGVTRIIRDLGSKITILLLDEFHHVAAELGKNEQAELRSAIDNISSFSLVLGVAQNPDEILEHIPYDTASELAPLINLALPKLARLENSEAHQLIRIGREQEGLAADSEGEDWLIESVGTHPLLLHAACFAWYGMVGEKAFSELSNDERNRAQTGVRREVESQWPYVVRALRAAARALLFDRLLPSNQSTLQEAREELERYGLTPWFRQSGVVRAADIRGPSSDRADNVEQLMTAVEELNDRHQLILRRRDWVFRTDRLSGNDGIYLGRHVQGQEDLARFVGALCRLLYDGSQGVVAPQLRGRVKPVLRGWCYRDPRSVITHLIALRNYHTHLLAPDPVVAAEHLQATGEVFELYCGKRAPEVADLETVRVGLLTAATRFVSRLNQFLPLSCDLQADQFFEFGPDEAPCRKAPFADLGKGDQVRDLVYISYRHVDREWHTKLRRVLDADPRLLDLVWDDTNIAAGTDWKRQINDHVARARVMIMLASNDYFAPDCGAAKYEIEPGLAAYERGEMVVLWFPVGRISIADSPVNGIMAATGVGAVPLELVSPEEQVEALGKVYREVLRHLGMPSLQAGNASGLVSAPPATQILIPAERHETIEEPLTRVTRLPEPSARRDLQKLAGCDNAERKIDIVFIHGLGGDSWTTWMAQEEAIETFWPNWLAEDLPQIGLWTLGYAASGSKWKEASMPLADRGNQVLDLLSNAGMGERPLVFITHSMGGIVAKEILRNAASFGVKRFEAIASRTVGIAFIATPHSGAHVANFAELAAAIYRTNEQVKELGAHDSRLRQLHGWFLNYQNRNNVICRTYCEKRELRPKIPLLRIKLPKGILVVDETSAEPNIPGERAIPLDEDHISICKPPSRDAQLYKGIVRFL